MGVINNCKILSLEEILLRFSNRRSTAVNNNIDNQSPTYCSATSR